MRHKIFTFHDFESGRHLLRAKNDYTLKSGMITGTKVKIIRNFISQKLWFKSATSERSFLALLFFLFPEPKTVLRFKYQVLFPRIVDSLNNAAGKYSSLEDKRLDETHSFTNSRIFRACFL